VSYLEPISEKLKLHMIYRLQKIKMKENSVVFSPGEVADRILIVIKGRVACKFQVVDSYVAS
jgi:hypothetical protein